MQHIGIFLIFAASVKSAGVYTSVKLYSLWKNFFARSFTPDEGYCQATQYNATQDNFTFLYYDRDTKPIKIVSGSIIGNKYSWNHSTACCISGISRLTLNEPPSTVLFLKEYS